MINKKHTLSTKKGVYYKVDKTSDKRWYGIETTSTTLKQRPPNFQIQPNFNVDTTLKIDVESTLIQRCCACWKMCMQMCKSDVIQYKAQKPCISISFLLLFTFCWRSGV